MTLPRILFAGLLLAILPHPLRAAEAEGEAKKTVEFPSPNGQFAFRFKGGEEEGDKKTFHLIGKRSGKNLLKIAESDPDFGPSGRFGMEVLWRPDSQAFAVTETLWKRGSSVAIYVREGGAFHEVKVPKLEANVPEKLKAGKEIYHVSELNSQSAKRWQKDGSLVAEIESIDDGNGGTATAKRTVVLDFEGSARAKVRKSTIKYTFEKT